MELRAVFKKGVEGSNATWGSNKEQGPGGAARLASPGARRMYRYTPVIAWGSSRYKLRLDATGWPSRYKLRLVQQADQIYVMIHHRVTCGWWAPRDHLSFVGVGRLGC
jgi:hypothetical protein